MSDSEDHVEDMNDESYENVKQNFRDRTKLVMIGARVQKITIPAAVKNYIYLHLPQDVDVKAKPRTRSTGRK